MSLLPGPLVDRLLRTKYSQNASESAEVVVKKLLSPSADFVEAFAKEAKLLSQIGHENIVGFKAVCQDPMANMLEYVYFDIGVFGGVSAELVKRFNVPYRQ